MESAHVDKTIWSKESQALRDALAKARKEAGFTQVQLAKKLKRPQSFVAKYEGGERRLDLIELMEIAKQVRLDLPALIKKL
jgi:transcriptional regulator with XRE-family HTH domain